MSMLSQGAALSCMYFLCAAASYFFFSLRRILQFLFFFLRSCAYIFLCASASTSASVSCSSTFSPTSLLFFSVSPTLCNHVRRYLQGLEKTYGGFEEAALQLQPIPTAFNSVPEGRWPLVMTFPHFLRMLDATLEKPFFSAAKAIDESTPAGVANKRALRHFLGWQGGELDFDPNKAVQYEDPFPASSRQIITFEEFAVVCTMKYF